VITPLILNLSTADAWRILAAIVALAVLFSLTVALKMYGPTLPYAWRRVLRAVTIQQACLAYAAVVRAHATPAGFPEGRVDLSIVLIVASGVTLLVCVVGVFGAHRHDHDRPGE
jgi:hypothetical protein